MHKKVLVCLPLNDAHRAALEASVPEFEFRFNALDDVHAEDVLWADVATGSSSCVAKLCSGPMSCWATHRCR